LKGLGQHEILTLKSFQTCSGADFIAFSR